LLHPLVEFASPRGQESSGAHIAGYLAIVLNMDYLSNRLLPELVHQHFGGAGGRTYRVEILDPGSPGQLVFRSDPSLPPLAPPEADISVQLIGRPVADLLRRSLAVTAATERPDRVGVPRPAMRGTPVILPEQEEGLWRLLVKYRAGSLAAAIAPLRRRNLALSFGVLLLLAVSMTLILVFTQRVERLAKLQLDFVAGVSHELRTPLAVIRSAADNLADGVVEPTQPVKEYGELIRDESRRLGAMVEQILRFAADKPGRQFDLRPIEISGAVATALVDSAPLIEKAGTSVEMNIEPGLPQALADQQGLQQCLLNLIGNAVKYGGDERWLAIRARQGERDGVPEVQITVEDKGLGIAPDESRQIFEPFYRGTAARTVGTHGTGLGLSLTNSIAEAMGGKITLESSPDRGSAFTLHLPVAEA
jgi:signal transduction histidine kinase